MGGCMVSFFLPCCFVPGWTLCSSFSLGVAEYIFLPPFFVIIHCFFPLRWGWSFSIDYCSFSR
ncbi:uncharacterized protein BDV14DRAFT_105356 [Aspergillus stella-maris]|uniref:uncharacterized protein n=1 Tax=Aspergillus stella-maris TaxID=1810926 RepID=UPI003CCE4E1C